MIRVISCAVRVKMLVILCFVINDRLESSLSSVSLID